MNESNNINSNNFNINKKVVYDRNEKQIVVDLDSNSHTENLSDVNKSHSVINKSFLNNLNINKFKNFMSDYKTSNYDQDNDVEKNNILKNKDEIKNGKIENDNEIKNEIKKDVEIDMDAHICEKFNRERYKLGVNKFLSYHIQKNEKYIDMQVNELNKKIVESTINSRLKKNGCVKNELISKITQLGLKNESDILSQINSKEFVSTNSIINKIKKEFGNIIHNEDEALYKIEVKQSSISSRKILCKSKMMPLKEFALFINNLTKVSNKVFENYCDAYGCDDDEIDEIISAMNSFLGTTPEERQSRKNGNPEIKKLVEKISEIKNESDSFYYRFSDLLEESRNNYKKLFNENAQEIDRVNSLMTSYNNSIEEYNNSKEERDSKLETYNNSINEIYRLACDFEEYQLADYAKKKIAFTSEKELKMPKLFFLSQVICGFEKSNSRLDYIENVAKEDQHSVYHWNLFINRLHNECVDLRSNHINANDFQNKSLSVNEINSNVNNIIESINIGGEKKYPMLFRLVRKVDGSGNEYPFSSGITSDSDYNSNKKYSLENKDLIKKINTDDIEFNYENPIFYDEKKFNDDKDVIYVKKFNDDNMISKFIQKEKEKDEKNGEFYDFFHNLRSEVIIHSTVINENNESNERVKNFLRRSILNSISDGDSSSISLSDEYKNKFKNSILENTKSDFFADSDQSKTIDVHAFIREKLTQKIGTTKEVFNNIDNLISIAVDNSVKEFVKSKIEEKVSSNTNVKRKKLDDDNLIEPAEFDTQMEPNNSFEFRYDDQENKRNNISIRSSDEDIDENQVKIKNNKGTRFFYTSIDELDK